MLPTLTPGDIVLAQKFSPTTRLNPGDVIVFRDTERDMQMIKRVVSVNEDFIEVSGDNQTESAEIKPVPPTLIIAVVKSVSANS